jgi:hypothetical protein
LTAVLVGAAERAAPRDISRDTPKKALERLKNAVRRSNHTEEWRCLSPDFRRRLSRQAGRNVDVADYSMFRKSRARDRNVMKLVSAMRTARITRATYRKTGRARVTIRFGGELIFGATTQVGMIHHRLWRLHVKGEPQPYWGYEGDWATKIEKGPGGSYTVKTFNEQGVETWSETFAADQVERYYTFTKWYFDDFGQAEQYFLNME